MKKRNLKNEPTENLSSGKGDELDEELHDELTDAISIKEFIKIKKLQNQILEKMLEKINTPDPKVKNQKKNK